MEKDLKDILKKDESQTTYTKVYEKQKEEEKEKKVLKRIPKVISVDENSKILETNTKKTKCIYDKEWSKLEKGLKLNRMNKYVQKIKDEENLDEQTSEKLKLILHRGVNENIIKHSDIVYENSEIVKINILENIDGKYVLKANKAKQRTSTKSKSKSNLDRLMKKK